MRKTLFVITNSDLCVWLSEVTHPYWHLSERGVAIDFASPKGGKVQWHPLSDPFLEGSREPNDLVSKGFLPDKTLVARLGRVDGFAQVERGGIPKSVNL